jgi:peptidoglycan/LPS O-acetylase OafA/YrhL
VIRAQPVEFSLMLNSPLAFPAVTAVAELAAAALFVATKDTVRRAALSCFGLGFAICIVLADIIPEATEDHAAGWLFLAAGLAVGVLLMFSGGRRGHSARLLWDLSPIRATPRHHRAAPGRLRDRKVCGATS